MKLNSWRLPTGLRLPNGEIGRQMKSGRGQVDDNNLKWTIIHSMSLQSYIDLIF